MNWIRRHKFKVLTIILAVCLAAVGFWRTGVEYSVNHGGKVQIVKAGLFTSLLPEASATIYFSPETGAPGRVRVWQSVFDGPITVIPARDAGVMLLLYDYDTGLHLFRIDINRSFARVPPGVLANVLFDSSWAIEDARATDWEDLLAYLHTVPQDQYSRQTVSLGFRSYSSPQAILTMLSYQNIK